MIGLVGYILLTGHILYKYQQDNTNKTFDFNFSARAAGDNFFNFFNFLTSAASDNFFFHKCTSLTALPLGSLTLANDLSQASASAVLHATLGTLGTLRAALSEGKCEANIER